MPLGSINCDRVLRPETTRRQASSSQTKTAILSIFIVCVALFEGTRFSASLQGTDFPNFYCAARMLAEGHGHQLYDPNLQRQYQARYAGGVGTLYAHPPFEASAFLAVAWLPLKQAYRLWFVLNLFFLAVAARRMARGTLTSWDWRVLLTLSLTFVPVLLCLLQGQDSLLFLLLVVLTFTALCRARTFAAGCWLGLGLIKPQVVLPMALILVFTQCGKARSEFAKAFGVITVAVAGLSAAMSGWSVFKIYPRFLLSLQAQPTSGVAPQVMANFHGLTSLFFRGRGSVWAISTISILSMTALIIALTVARHARPTSHRNPSVSPQNEFDLVFANAVTFALLVSYYLNPHDLSLVLLPIAVLLHRGLVRKPPLPNPLKWITFGLIAILFLPPLHVYGLMARVYALIALPMLFLFLTTWILVQRSRVSHETLHVHED